MSRFVTNPSCRLLNRSANELCAEAKHLDPVDGDIFLRRTLIDTSRLTGNPAVPNAAASRLSTHLRAEACAGPAIELAAVR